MIRVQKIPLKSWSLTIEELFMQFNTDEWVESFDRERLKREHKFLARSLKKRRFISRWQWVEERSRRDLAWLYLFDHLDHRLFNSKNLQGAIQSKHLLTKKRLNASSIAISDETVSENRFDVTVDVRSQASPWFLVPQLHVDAFQRSSTARKNAVVLRAKYRLSKISALYLFKITTWLVRRTLLLWLLSQGDKRAKRTKSRKDKNHKSDSNRSINWNFLASK